MDEGTFGRLLRHRVVEEDRARGGVTVDRALLDELSLRIAGESIVPGGPIDAVLAEILVEARMFGPLWRLMFDREVSEIMVNGPDLVFVERNGAKQREPGEFFRDAEGLHSAIERIMRVDSDLRLDQSRPWADLALPGGSRANIAIPPIAHGSPHLTIRKYQGVLKSMDDMIQAGTLDVRMAELLVHSTRIRKNILFSGATSTGKTTLLEVLSRHIPEGERVICIEDTLELHLAHENVVRLLTRTENFEGKGEVSIGDLFRNSLRMCPDRVLLGEIRGKEAYDYLQALNSGHDGSLAVIHASSPVEAVVRLQNLVPLAGLGVPPGVVRRQISAGLDLIVQMHQLADGSRKVTRITEVGEPDASGELTLVDLFRFDVTRRGERGIEGRFVATGNRPSFFDDLARSGEAMRESLFQER